MRAEAQKLVESIEEALDLLRRHLDPVKAEARLAELNHEAENPDLWNNPQNAQSLMRQRQQLEQALSVLKSLETDLEDARTLVELGETEGDADTIAEGEAALARLVGEVQSRSVEALLSGEADANNSYLEVHAGAGGTESQDWAEMLLRMYMRWAERRGFAVKVLDESRGEEAGIKSATLEVSGEKAFGWLKTEAGVHRLVRISPFDSNARRHTSFASVGVYPVIDDTIDIEIDPSDLEMSFTRSSGAGGQHVNRTESAVRIVHKPSGIAIFSQEQRSQHQNRDIAMKRLKARLYDLELKRREERAMEANAAKSDIGWGHQIRSYVLQPYQLVKDLRTGQQSSDPSAVLDGDLDPFIEAALAHRLEGGTSEVEAEDVE
ncbi:MAG: peptide chain release factor 2 [Alphaproteobacteria bacterium]|nr:peptide chain release factor 2 [Alphaproteobacteria bacterium]